LLAVVRRDRHREHAWRRLDRYQRTRCGLAVAERISGLDRIELAESNGLTDFGRGALGVVGAIDGEDAGHAAGSTRGGLQCRTILEMAGQESRQRQLTAVLQVHGLEHIAERILALRHAET